MHARALMALLFTTLTSKDSLSHVTLSFQRLKHYVLLKSKEIFDAFLSQEDAVQVQANEQNGTQSSLV